MKKLIINTLAMFTLYACAPAYAGEEEPSRLELFCDDIATASVVVYERRHKGYDIRQAMRDAQDIYGQYAVEVAFSIPLSNTVREREMINETIYNNIFIECITSLQY